MRPGRNAWLLAGAIAVGGALALLTRDRAPSLLVSTAHDGFRRIEPRLSGGFVWAPLRDANVRGASAVAPAPELAEAIAATLARHHEHSTPTTSHSAAIAHLLAGRPRDALEILITVADPLNEPDAFSDLAAAFLEEARHDDAPDLLAEALAAADHALALDPRHPEALFNRALVLERLGMRDDAREAWMKFLGADATSGWSGEARAHIEGLAPVPRFLESLDREYDRVVEDPAVARILARSDPFGARGVGIRDVLGRWATAVLQGDAPAAARHLTVARRLGDAIAADGGDRMLQRAVAVIDDAGLSGRRVLATAHDEYRNGMLAFAGSRPVDAESMLRRAAAGFTDRQSPVALAARYFAANARFEQGHRDQAEQDLDRLLRIMPAEFPAYRAFVEWELGICRSARANWGSAIVILEQSAATFERLNETENAAGVHRTLAFIHDRIGDRERASTYWLVALRGLGRRTDLPLSKAVESIADDAIVRRQWHVAASFLTLHIGMSRRRGEAMQHASSLFLRAAVFARMNDPERAAADVASGNAVAADVKDSAYRDYLRIAELRARAMLSTTPPAEAVDLLTRALADESALSTPMDVPGLLLARARARRASGDLAGAAADLERGIVELERHRESLPAGQLRWGAFHAAEELFDESIDVAIERDDVDSAFRFSERARARSLLDSYGRAATVEAARIPAGTIVVEYAVLSSRLVIFIAERSGVHATVLRLDRNDLVRDIESLRLAVRSQSSDEVSVAAATVYRHLIAPVAARIAGATKLVIVADAATSSVPFSALGAEGGESLIQQHTVIVAPSAAAYLVAAERRASAGTPKSALVVSSSASADSELLVFADKEAERIASMYESAKHLRDSTTDADEILEQLSEADVVHFAGHAIGDSRGFEPASIVLRQHGGERRVRVAEIAELRLRPTSTVILAGCNTARGQRRAAEGVISVAHGFLTAGAPSVIATLWPIDDEAAARFFPRLHQRLASGMSPADALRDVQIECIRRGDVPISLWAAVQNIGS